MKKNIFVCKECGYESPKWLGRCPSCHAWNSFVEKTVESSKTEGKSLWLASRASKPQKIQDIEQKHNIKLKTDIKEFDRVMSGGLTKGSFVLLAGEPGIGKSTFLLQIASKLGKQGKILYISGEESQSQIAERAKRLGINTDNIYVLSESSLEKMINAVNQTEASFLFLDSIQTTFTESIDTQIGSVSQVKECGARLLALTKATGITTIITGHVTKVGDVAGPRTLEHMVDTVLMLEGEKSSEFRILRAVKNRFGSLDEIGLFQLKEKGLIPVSSEDLNFVHNVEKAPGNAVIPITKGSRVLLVEAQALVSATPFSMPMRNANGFDLRKLQILLAVLENNLSLSIRSKDVFVNITGGFKIQDSSADLGVAAAILSAFFKKRLPMYSAFIGEVGLTGEIRKVSDMKRKIDDLIRFGYKKIFVPLKKMEKKNSANIITVQSIKEVVELCFG